MNFLKKATVGITIAASIAAAAQAGTVYVGNNLNPVSGPQIDGDPPLVILGEYDPAGPLATAAAPDTLPTGNVTQLLFNSGTSSYGFTLYALSLVGSNPTLNEQTFQVVASQSFSGGPSSGIQTLPVSGFSVTSGDLLAFAGTGIEYTGNDVPNTDSTYEDSTAPGSFVATPPSGVAGTQFTVGANPDSSANYEYIQDVFGNQGRTYAVGVDVTVPDSGDTLFLLAPVLVVLAAMKRRSFARA